MTPDRAAIAALTQALRQASAQHALDLEQTATLAVTTLQGIGWRASHLPAWEKAMADPDAMRTALALDVGPTMQYIRIPTEPPRPPNPGRLGEQGQYGTVDDPQLGLIGTWLKIRRERKGRR